MIAKAEQPWEEPKIETETKHYFLCPECGKYRHSYGHLLDGKEQRWGTWFCGNCGLGVDVHVTAEGKLTVKQRPEVPRFLNQLVLLRRGNLFLVVKHRHAEDTTEDQVRYYFDEHTCPTNYFRDTQVIIQLPDNADPHGLFSYVCSAPDTVNDIINRSAEELFEHFGVKVTEEQ